MESGGRRTGSDAVPGAGAEGGLLCHACGYQYPNAHPSAKQRRAHRKHCGKPASPAAEAGGAGEAQGRALVPGEGGGAGVGAGGDGVGAGAVGCGGAVPVSAQESASEAVDVDKTEHSSHDVAGAQVIIDRCGEDRSDVASGITAETIRTDAGGTLNEVAMEHSGKASLPEDGVPSVPASAVSSEQFQDVSVPVLPPEPGYGEGVSPKLSVSEMQNADVSQASDATGGEIYEQTNDVITEPNGTTVTGVDGTANSIGRDISVEEKSIKVDDLDCSYQEKVQTTVGEGQSNTAVEEDSSDKNLNAVQIKEVRNDKPESNLQSSPRLASSIEVVPNTEDEEPVKSGTQAPVATDDFHSEATDTVKPQERPDSISVSEDHLAVLEQTEIFEGEHYPNKDGGIKMISSAMEPAIEVISVGDADNMTKNASSSDVTMGDTIQENVTSNTIVPSQADLVDLSTSSTAHEINMVNRTNDVEEKDQNEKSVADLTTHEIEVHITELVEEKQQDKEIVADSISHESNGLHSIDNYGKNEKETIAEASSRNTPSTSSIEEEKQIEEVIANPALEKANMTSNRNGLENKQIEVDAKTNRETSVVCTTEATEEMDTTSEINAENIIDNVEDKESEEISAGNISDGTSMVYTSVTENKMHNEDMTADSSSHEKTVVHITDNVEEKKHEETMVDPTSHSVGMVTTIDSVGERKNDETSADLTSHGTNAEHTTDNVKEKDGEPILEPLSSKISTLGSVGGVEEKKKNEETTADKISGENNMPQSTHDAEKGIQNKGVATVLVSDKSEVAKIADAVEGTEQNNETAAKEISKVPSMDDLKGAGQNEEIADKEVIMDSDRSHVSLKVLLADKNVETKEKKPSTKDRVLSFRRRSSKDNESPVKPGSPNAGYGQQDWNSPARLPTEKKSKGKKQQWVPFICCSSIH